MSKTLRPPLLVLLVGWLLACQQPGGRQSFFDSPLQPGDEVRIRRVLTVPAGLARIYLQGGRTMGYAATNQYAPFCSLLVREPLPVEQHIEPGDFVVASVWLDETTVARERARKVAALQLAGGGDWTPIAYQFHIRLRADNQTPLLMVCSGAFDDAVSARPIRLQEMREVLGGFAELGVKSTQHGR